MFQTEGSRASARDLTTPREDAATDRTGALDRLGQSANRHESSERASDFGPDLTERDVAFSASAPLFQATGSNVSPSDISSSIEEDDSGWGFDVQQHLDEQNQAAQLGADLADRLESGSGVDGSSDSGGSNDGGGSGAWGYADVVEAPDDSQSDWYTD